MDPMRIVRYVVLVLAAGAVIFGLLIMIGLLVPANVTIPENLRIVFGLVVVLYGVYRFVVTFNQQSRP